MADNHKNFAVSTIATPPNGTSGTSLTVAAGTGTLFPTAPFNVTVWPVNVQPTAANAEIMRVTVKATDTFTVTRAQESTTAKTHAANAQVAATITAKTLTDVEAPTNLTVSEYLSLPLGLDALACNGVRLGGVQQRSGSATGFDIFPMGDSLSYYIVIAGQDVADGTSTASYVDVVVARDNGGVFAHAVHHSTSLNGSPGARTYSLNSGNLYVAHASGTTWYVDVFVMRFSQ